MFRYALNMSNEATRARSRIFVVEDHALMRRSIVRALERESGFVVCGQSDDVPDALAAIDSLNPDLVLTDLELKGSSGFDLIRALSNRKSCPRVVAISMFDVLANERRALAAGACSFVAKQHGPGPLVDAVRDALSVRADNNRF